MASVQNNRINSQDRCGWIDNAKGLAIIFVVIGHVITNGMSSGILQNSAFPMLEKIIYSFHMPLFFFCSGYLIKPQIQSSIHKLTSYYKGKIIGLLIPYILFSLLYLGLKCVFETEADVVTNKAKWSDGLYLFSTPIGEYWFLYTLIFFTILFYAVLLTSRLIKKDKQILFINVIVASLFFTGVFSLFSRQLLMQSNIWFGIKRSLFYLPFFSGGYLICRTGMFETLIDKYITLIITAVVSVILLIIKLKGIDDSVLLRLVIAFSLIIFFCSFSIYLPRLNGYIGRNTMVIYVFHVYFIVASKVLLSHCLSQWLYTIVVSVLSVICPLLIYKFIKKYKYLDFLIYPNKYLIKK